MDIEVADGVWMAAAGRTDELFVPRLFADTPIVLHAPDLGVCRPDELVPEELPVQAGKLEIAMLHKGREEVTLVVVLAEPRRFPPVRRRARFGAEVQLRMPRPGSGGRRAGRPRGR